MDNQQAEEPNLSLPKALGYFLTILGGLIAIGTAIYITHNAEYLWSLILLAICVQRVDTTMIEYRWKPTVLGLVMCLLCIALAMVVWYVKEGAYLWAMLLIAFLTDQIV